MSPASRHFASLISGKKPKQIKGMDMGKFMNKQAPSMTVKHIKKMTRGK